MIIPVLNGANFLEETIVSFIEQNYPKKELLILDGGSTDGTLEIIRKYQKHIAYLECTPDKGQADAINKGLIKCNGEIVNWLNADDLLLPNALKIIAEKFNASPNLEVVCGRCLRFQNGNLSNAKGFSQTFLQNSLEKTLIWPSMGQPAQFYRKSIFEKFGLLNSTYHFSFDREFWLRYLIGSGQKNVLTFNDYIAAFRIHPLSKTSKHTLHFKLEDKAIVTEIMKVEPHHGTINRSKLLGYYFSKLTTDFYASHHYNRARWYASLTIKTMTFDGKGFFLSAVKVLLLPNFLLDFIRHWKYRF